MIDVFTENLLSTKDTADPGSTLYPSKTLHRIGELPSKKPSEQTALNVDELKRAHHVSYDGGCLSIIGETRYYIDISQ